ncbi:copper chaperone NosL [Pricia antarctica]|uniref:Copper chaperone NosL n=1 Tax=Pricia antarctica TaxID=641691 RepID=A0A1G7D951_9FLAO|nr:nitrous oxide reductase accessory protein NosL [Pricia antarctica]SDE48029.1 copper chaperone NosL [Pricia antarctica]
MKYTSILLISLLILGGCKIDSDPINYGSDACHYCSMTIVDKQHATEYVTDTGKAFKFDAIECMMNDLKDTNDTKIALFLVNDFENPGQLINGTKATYLISKNITSPMGGNLSAFENRAAADSVQSELQGELFTWEELKKRLTNQ